MKMSLKALTENTQGIFLHATSHLLIIKAHKNLWTILAYLNYVLEHTLINAISLFHCSKPQSLQEFSFSDLNTQIILVSIASNLR